MWSSVKMASGQFDSNGENDNDRGTMIGLSGYELKAFLLLKYNYESCRPYCKFK